MADETTTGTYRTFEQVQESWKYQPAILAPMPSSNPNNVTTDPNALSYVTPVEEGPLGDLYRNQYNTTSIAYPRDLDSFDKGHAIQFVVRDIKPFTVDAKTVEEKIRQIDLKQLLNATSEAARKILPNAKELEAAYTADPVGAAATTLSAGVDMLNNAMGFLQMNPETYSEPTATIRLYMPDTLNFSYQAQYDKLSLADAVNSTPLIGKISTALTSMINNNMSKLISKKLGYTFNPQQQMLFEGIDFREFDLQFTFTPTSPDEAANVREIIRLFQRAAAPTKQQGISGFFWLPPSIFELGFFFNGQRNLNVPPVLRCVLQSVTADYAPNGWTALADGAPVQTTLSLSFKEIELMDRTIMDKTSKGGYA